MNRIPTRMYDSINDFLVKNRRPAVIFVHLIHTALANYLAFIIRFESAVPSHYKQMMLTYLPVLLITRLIFYVKDKLYQDIWSYSSVNDMLKIMRSSILGSITFFVTVRYLFGNTSYPISVYILDLMLITSIAGGSRLFIRVLREYLHPKPTGKKILLIGAGDAGEIIVRDLKGNPNSSYEPIGFLDDDPYKKGLVIRGVPIFGPISLLPHIIEERRPEEILITMPSADASTIRRIYELCKPYNISIKKLPGIEELLSGNVAVATKLGQHLVDANLVTEEDVKEALQLQRKEGGRLGSKLVKLGYISEDMLIAFLNKQFGISHMKPISLEDLLQREPVRTDIESVSKFIKGKTVLVTGAGGSIGSELCRQIKKYNPSNMVLLDRYENTLFKIDLELRSSNGNGSDHENGNGNGASHYKIIPVIGDVTDITTLEYVFDRYKPQIIFHAAAHKHVPLMEFNPVEAVRNNILGTRNLVDIASKYMAESFVMISTDKAVNPTSVMGATKRIAEFLTITRNASSKTKYTTVRFGNVLGSNGSVVPIFTEQIKHGGPLTVTHPDIRRYFMLIPEAVQLVLLASSSGNGGEIFVLDMGEPIRIGDLAENLIRLSGFIPNKEIKIQYTGLRPGEKLYEELFDKSEKIIPTFHQKLRIAVPNRVSESDINACLMEFENIVNNYSVEDIIPSITKIVPNFSNGQIPATLL